MSSQCSGGWEVFAEALSLIAGYGLRACLIAQDLSQIHAAYGHDESITSNCNTRVAFTPNRIETARWISNGRGDYGASFAPYRYKHRGHHVRARDRALHDDARRSNADE